jgi:DNA-binding transcriptional LysR family regulator
LVATERFAAGVEALREGVEPHLRVAASLTIAEYLLPDWLIECRKSREDWAVDLEVENSVIVADRVATRAVDVGFVESPRHFEGLTSEVIGHDELIIVVGHSHPWTRRRAPLTPAHLASAALLLREPGSGTREFFDDAMRREGFEPPQPHGVFGSTTALKAAVAGGTACTVLSELAVVPELASGRLVRIPTEGLDLTRTLRAIWCGPSPPGAAVSLLEVARAQAGRFAES